MKPNTIFREFFRYSSLNVLGMLGLSCYILADTFFISQGLGANGLAALNLAIPVYSFIHGCGLMLGVGGGTRFSIAKGQNKCGKGNTAFTHTLFLAVLLALGFVITGILFSDALTIALGADEAVFAMCRTYIRVLLLFSPFFIVNEVILGFVRNDGAPRLAMTAMLGGSLSNIILDYLFIFPLGMGIFGAVLATALAPIISLLIQLPHFTRQKNTFFPVKCRLSLRLAAGIMAIGAPSLVTEVSSGVVIIVFNFILLNLCGNIGVAAYGVIANLSLVVMAIYTGIAQGIQPILSVYCGRGDQYSIKKCFRYAILAIILLSILLYSTVFLFAAQITALFNSENNADLQRIAEEGLRVYFIGGLFAGLNIMFCAYFTATDAAPPANVLSLLRGFAVILPFAFLLSTLWGLVGLWAVFPAAEGLVFLIGVALYFSRHPTNG